MTVHLYARAEVVRLLGIDRTLLARLEEEEVVLRRAGGYTADDLERLRVAAELADLGVNEEGIEVVLRMREQWLAERRELHELIDALRERVARGS